MEEDLPVFEEVTENGLTKTDLVKETLAEELSTSEEKLINLLIKSIDVDLNIYNWTVIDPFNRQKKISLGDFVTMCSDINLIDGREDIVLSDCLDLFNSIRDKLLEVRKRLKDSFAGAMSIIHRYKEVYNIYNQRLGGVMMELETLKANNKETEDNAMDLELKHKKLRSDIELLKYHLKEIQNIFKRIDEKDSPEEEEEKPEVKVPEPKPKPPRPKIP